MPTLPVIPSPAPTGRRAAGPAIAPEHSSDAIARGLGTSIEGEVRFDLHNRMLYATDASLYQVRPLGVVIPAGVEDAARAVEYCAAHGVPILPRGGGTSLAGQCVNRAVVIDFSARCAGLQSVDAGGRRCGVEPGITVDDLNERLVSYGLFFAPDPATTRQANIGGCIGNNAAGARSILYKRTSENLHGVEALVLAGQGPRRVRLERGAAARDPFVRDLTLRVLEVVLANAALIRERFPKTIRRNAGYNLDLILQQWESAGERADADEALAAINLSHLICGSEGTLAVVLGADLALHPVPPAKGLAVVGFGSLEAAIDAVAPILASGPSAVELLDDTVLDLARANTEYRHYAEMMPAPASGPPRAVLYVEYFGTAESLPASFHSLRGIIAGASPSAGLAVFTESGAMLAAWKLRKAGEPLLHGMPGDRKPITFVEDNAVPVEHLGEFVREFRRIVESRGTRAAYWAHASVGVLHIRPFLDIRDERDRRLMQQIAAEAADLARSLGGVMSGEHGDGRVRGPLLERFYGPELMRAFREVKAIFDPRNLLNPGNIVEPGPLPSIAESIRVKPAERFVEVPPVDTYFGYEDQHGFRGAVEMCNGAGVCRKRSGGTMCPSFMGTLDERHSTRGRGNALRLAITGQLADEWAAATGGTGRSLWNDPGTIETLDLCLSCKACKAECPSNVDIARLKAEYTAQRYRSTGRIPLRARAFGHVRTLNRVGAIAPGLANWANRRTWVRAVLDRMLGLAHQRSIPAFARSLRRQWGRDGGPETGPGARPAVALFGDCFTMYNEPGIGLAARRTLEAFGYRVILADAGCCGRAMISTGLLDDAGAAADRALGRLDALVEREGLRAILVAEPSCLSAIKDDWLQLRLRTPAPVRRRIAAMSWMIEEFLARDWESHPVRPAFKPGTAGAGPRSVLLHGHCHQKALWGAQSSADLLRRLGLEVRIPDSGCCGMAGSFGYTADHYDLSMRIGELVLFPAVRSASGDDVIVTPGTSCRHQIHDGTGRTAMHPIELVASLLAGK
ncbi:MAG: FAD-linked oxidase C-terminal domain-containing protein [Phycisphaerales bacterium]